MDGWHSLVQDNGIGEGGAVALARALELNVSVTVLNLRVCGGEGGVRTGDGKGIVFGVDLHAVEPHGRRRNGGVGKGAGVQQLYYYLESCGIQGDTGEEGEM